MFADQFKARALSAPRAAYPGLASELWAAYGAGAVTEDEAEALSALVAVQSAPNGLQAAPIDRRDRSPRSIPREDVERRRRWASAGRMPPALASRFTQAEAAVLAVLSLQVARFGACTLPLVALARLAGVSRSTAKAAIREARALGLVQVQERRLSRWRSDTNVVRIVSAEWSAWIARRAGGGVKSATPLNTRKEKGAIEGRRMAGTGPGLLSRKSPTMEKPGERCPASRKTRTA